MQLYFRNAEYLKKALGLAENPPESTHTFNQALILCLSPARYEQLDNLCAYMHRQLPGLSSEECYQLTRGENVPGEAEFSDNICSVIWESAMEMLKDGQKFGSELAEDGVRNTSTLWGHLFLESKVAGQLAEAHGLQPDTAKKLGLLHDFGRTVSGTLEHGLRGFELLSDMGWDREALGALTHSFFRGGRCTGLEEHIPGFYVDDEGTPCFDDTVERDDVTLFLEKYTYTQYDVILNIADLMATTWAIVPPAERVADVMTRRVFDPVNHWLFIAELTNTLWEMNASISSKSDTPVKKIKASADTSSSYIQAEFERASAAFFETYKSVCR